MLPICEKIGTEWEWIELKEKEPICAYLCVRTNFSASSAHEPRE
jgi:uncharacterized OB-fold protein